LLLGGHEISIQQTEVWLGLAAGENEERLIGIGDENLLPFGPRGATTQGPQPRLHALDFGRPVRRHTQPDPIAQRDHISLSPAPGEPTRQASANFASGGLDIEESGLGAHDATGEDFTRRHLIHPSNLR
jgi:hypothetical protein